MKEYIILIGGDNLKAVFPSTNELASYSYLSQTIVLNEIARNSLNECVKNPFDHNNIGNFKTISHEITHYLDNITTLVGKKILKDAINALNIISQERLDVGEFWRFITLRNTIRRTTYDNYYKKLNLSVQTTSRPEDWSYRNTIGCRFDVDGRIDEGKPIIFCNFNCNEVNVARVPFSIEALFEINAMANEVYLHNRYLYSHDLDFQTIEKITFLNSTYDWIYNKELLTYSVAAHIVAPIVDSRELVEIFLLAKLISTLSLNLPSALYKQIRWPEYFRETSIERIRGFIDSNDPNFAFVCLVQNYIESEMVYTDFNYTTLIDEILTASKLPHLNMIRFLVKAEMSDIRTEVTDGYYSDIYNNHTELADRILERRDIYGFFDENFFSDFNIDSFLTICEDEVMDQEFPINHHERVSVYEEHIFDFISACGY